MRAVGNASDRCRDMSEEVLWPTFSQVTAAQFDLAQLLAWNRTLPRPDTSERREIIAKVIRYLAPALRKAGTRAQPDQG